MSVPDLYSVDFCHVSFCPHADRITSIRRTHAGVPGRDAALRASGTFLPTVSAAYQHAGKPETPRRNYHDLVFGVVLSGGTIGTRRDRSKTIISVSLILSSNQIQSCGPGSFLVVRRFCNTGKGAIIIPAHLQHRQRGDHYPGAFEGTQNSQVRSGRICYHVLEQHRRGGLPSWVPLPYW